MNKKKIVLMLLIFAMVFIVGKETYAYYFSRTNVSVKSTSSNIKCDAVIGEVSSSEKSKFGYSEFKVTVKNYDSSNNLSGEPFGYTLNIENNGGTNGVFGYNHEFDSNLEITDTMNNNENSEKSYIIQVKSNSGSSEDVGYKVRLNCTQQN